MLAFVLLTNQMKTFYSLNIQNFLDIKSFVQKHKLKYLVINVHIKIVFIHIEIKNDILLLRLQSSQVGLPAQSLLLTAS